MSPALAGGFLITGLPVVMSDIHILTFFGVCSHNLTEDEMMGWHHRLNGHQFE